MILTSKFLSHILKDKVGSCANFAFFVQVNNKMVLVKVKMKLKKQADQEERLRSTRNYLMPEPSLTTFAR